VTKGQQAIHEMALVDTAPDLQILVNRLLEEEG
jgi:hypothetical protein